MAGEFLLKDLVLFAATPAVISAEHDKHRKQSTMPEPHANGTATPSSRSRESVAGQPRR